MKTMKHSFQFLISVVSAALLIQGCTYKDNPSQVEQTSVRTLHSLTKSVSNSSTPVVKEKPKVITRDALNDILSVGLQGTTIKDTKRFTLKTISEGDTPLIHSVNFNDGGWALVAGRELPNNQIIAYGEDGSFDPDNIENPEVRFWFRMTKTSLIQTYENADREAESQIGTASIQEEEENLIDSFSYDDPYVWVRLYLGYENSNIVSNVYHLTKTQWGQNYPWNYKCPTINNSQCPTGCLTVAVAQLLYYLHFHLGTPSGCFHTVDTSYTWHNAGYYTSTLTRSNYTAPSPRWSAMPKVSYYLNDSTRYVGNLMIDVADRLGTYFRATGSSANFTPDVFPYFGITCSVVQQYNSSQVIAQLNNSMPVLMYGDDSSNNNPKPHSWLIDGYKQTVTQTDHQYKWVMMPPDSLQYYNNINYDYVFTETEMQQFHPDVVENQIDHEYSYSSPSYLFRMNWGWDGLCNGFLYSIQPDGWTPVGHQFNLSTAMITGFTN